MWLQLRRWGYPLVGEGGVRGQVYKCAVWCGVV